ncbi:ThiF family adenylyltransferase [Brevibacterium litoralis]|uniref:ThiF family adenylyltransferase n=1 Tax=Brevibacterium litoralis TaxID=3138935 RepID=UPI003D9A7662
MREPTAAAWAAAARIATLNPEVEVRTHRARVDATWVVDLLRGYDVVVDGSDNFATRYLIADASEITGVPVVWGAILRGSGQVSVFWPGRGPHYRDLFPEAPPPDQAPSCAEAGVLGTLPGLLGTLMSTQVIQLVTGTGSPLVGRLLLWDEATHTSRVLRVTPDPDRSTATRVETPATAGSTGGPSPDETVGPAALRELLTAGVTLVDVREPWEFAAGAVPGATNVPLDRVLTLGSAALPRGDDLVLYCQGGVRSARALDRLRPDWATREGRLRHLEGGYAAWEAAAGPG